MLKKKTFLFFLLGNGVGFITVFMVFANAFLLLKVIHFPKHLIQLDIQIQMSNFIS